MGERRRPEAPGGGSVRLWGGTQQPGLTRLCIHSRELRNNGSKLSRLPPLLQASLDSAITSCSHSNKWGCGCFGRLTRVMMSYAETDSWPGEAP